jgi:hypothetical protein
MHLIALVLLCSGQVKISPSRGAPRGPKNPRGVLPDVLVPVDVILSLVPGWFAAGNSLRLMKQCCTCPMLWISDFACVGVRDLEPA